MYDSAQMSLFSAVMLRITGYIWFHPIFGRRNLPSYYKSGMILILSILIYGLLPVQTMETGNVFELAVVLLAEFTIGYLFSFLTDLSLMIITFSGAVMDYQMGLSMATVYDPSSNSQTALTGSIWNIGFMLMFLASDGHLVLIRLLAESFQIIPPGLSGLARNVLWALPEFFIQNIGLGLRLAFPLIAMELLTEVAVGILMKVIPQINVFAVNIQAKILIGLLMLLYLFTPMSDFVIGISDNLFEQIQTIFRLMRAG